MVHNCMHDIALCISFCTSVAVREHLARRKQFINIMSIDKFWTICSCQALWTFWTTFWLAFDFGSNRIWEISEPYTSVQDPSRPRKFRSSGPVRVKNAKNRYIFLKLRMCMIPTYVSNMAYNSFELLQILDLITFFSKEIVLFYFKH